MRDTEREADIGRGRSRLHAGIPMWDSIRNSRITPWAKGRRSTAGLPRHPGHCIFYTECAESVNIWELFSLLLSSNHSILRVVELYFGCSLVFRQRFKINPLVFLSLLEFLFYIYIYLSSSVLPHNYWLDPPLWTLKSVFFNPMGLLVLPLLASLDWCAESASWQKAGAIRRLTSVVSLVSSITTLYCLLSDIFKKWVFHNSVQFSRFLFCLLILFFVFFFFSMRTDPVMVPSLRLQM